MSSTLKYTTATPNAASRMRSVYAAGMAADRRKAAADAKARRFAARDPRVGQFTCPHVAQAAQGYFGLCPKSLEVALLDRGDDWREWAQAHHAPACSDGVFVLNEDVAAWEADWVREYGQVGYHHCTADC